MNHQPQYGKASYWDDRYTKDPEIFDWYQVCVTIRKSVCHSVALCASVSGAMISHRLERQGLLVAEGGDTLCQQG